MATFLHSYDLEGKKESVGNFITNVSPTETPFTSMTKKVGITNTTFSWLADNDGAADLTNAVAEGADATDSNLTEPVKYTSFTQIFTKVAKVSGTAEKMGLYGRGSAMAYQMMKAGRQIKRDIEATLLSSQSAVAAASGVVGKLDGFATERVDAGGLKVARVKHVKTAATAKTFSEAELQELLVDIWNDGGAPTVIMFPPEYAAQLSALRDKNASMNMFDGESSATVNRQVDVYVDPLGNRLKLIPNRYMPKDKMYVFSPEKLVQHIFRGFQTSDLAKNGDYIRKQLIVELGFGNLAPEASGIYSLKA